MKDSSMRGKYKFDLNYDRGELLTEQNNPKSINIDKIPTKEIVELFNKEDQLPQLAVKKAIPEITRAIDEITLRLKSEGRLFYLGAGTSGRIGVIDAAECPPTFCTPPDLVQAIIAGGTESLISSSEGKEDIEKLAKEDLKKKYFSNKDCLIGITAGGTTPYVKSGLVYAKELKALSIAISCVPYDQAPLPCEIDIRLLTGPELIVGSTRLKAGTATKMALNIISSAVMIRLGKVLGNRMVDVAVTNKKLLDRSLRILKDVVDADKDQAISLLNQTNGSVKLAILIAISNLDIEQAKSLLSTFDGHLRPALEYINCQHKLYI